MYELHYFNSVALSDKNIPLPIDDSEEILYFGENLYFRFLTKGQQQAIESLEGTIYLTSYRIIYIPTRAAFSSFYVPLNKIFTVQNNNYIECHCENNCMGFIYLNFRDWQNKIFFNLLASHTTNITVDIDADSLEDNNAVFYSDIVVDE